MVDDGDVTVDDGDDERCRKMQNHTCAALETKPIHLYDHVVKCDSGSWQCC